MSDSYDVLIIGGGQAGIPLAHALARAGKSVALAERKWLGGSCINFGCTPTKAAIASARVAHLARRAAEYGVVVPSVAVDFGAVLARARDIAESMRRHLHESFEGVDNPRLLAAHARFLGKDGDAFRLAVGDREVRAAQVVLDVGTRSAVPAIDGLGTIGFIDSENWLEHRTLPSRLVLVGGGYIGLEMAQFYRRMGSHAVVIERGDQVAGHEDRDVADALRAMLEGEGIEFRMKASARKFRKTAAGVTVTIEREDGQETLDASHVFLALGRQPNTDQLGLESIGLAPDEHGILPTDARLATTVQGVWAAGDIRGGPMFTHSAWDDYRILESQLVGDGSRSLERIVPYAVFTDPELGRVGLGEDEARRQGRKFRVGRFDMKNNGKARELGETTGFIKVVADADDDRLLGAAVFAPEAAELVHIYVALMNAGAPCSVIEEAIHIHPTLAEAAQSAIAALR